MGFFNFGNRNRTLDRVRGARLYILTPRGEQAFDENVDDYSEEMQILVVFMEKKQPLSVKEISKESTVNENTVVKNIYKLLNKGYIQSYVAGNAHSAFIRSPYER